MEHNLQLAEQGILHVYNRFPILLDHGEGVYLYDTDGKKYLDFAAGFAVSALGYGNPRFNQALKDQIDQLMHTSNLYFHEAGAKAADALNHVTGMDRVFFTNSGSEAIEGALKVARKYAWAKGSKKTEIIAFEHSFHGRTLGSLSITGHTPYREPFEPLIPGVTFAEFNNLEHVQSLASEETCAIIVEPLQGEGGINLCGAEFLQGLRNLCDKLDILLIFDEIQCGMGRTGVMFAHQMFGVKPDILVIAKGIGNGFPVGAFAMTQQVAGASLKPGDHGTTYGGNPLACVAIHTVLEIFEDEQIVEHVQEVGLYLKDSLDALATEYDCVVGRRGIGLMQGIELSVPAGEVNQLTLKEGLLVIQAQGNVIRFVPPLIIEKAHIDEMIVMIKKVLDTFES